MAVHSDELRPPNPMSAVLLDSMVAPWVSAARRYRGEQSQTRRLMKMLQLWGQRHRNRAGLETPRPLNWIWWEGTFREEALNP